MAAWNPEANAIFLNALDYQVLEQRRAYIAQACRGDEALLAQVWALLKAYVRAGRFLEDSAANEIQSESNGAD